MAKGKNRNRPVVSAEYTLTWHYWLTAHALVHGGVVAMLTSNWYLGVLETLCHWLIDFGKCENVYGIHVDQGLHVFCKVCWTLVVMGYV
jgi:hypothetical protein